MLLDHYNQSKHHRSCTRYLLAVQWSHVTDLNLYSSLVYQQSRSDLTCQPRTDDQPAKRNQQEESQLCVVLNERCSNVTTVHVITVADLHSNSVSTATFKAPATFSWSHVSKHSTLAYVPHIPVILVICYKHHDITRDVIKTRESETKTRPRPERPRPRPRPRPGRPSPRPRPRPAGSRPRPRPRPQKSGLDRSRDQDQVSRYVRNVVV